MKSKISPLQFSVLLGLSSLGFVTLYYDSITCFSMIISVVISFLLLVPTLIISYKMDYTIPTIFRFLSVIFILLLSVMLVNKYSLFFTTLINPETPKWIISGLLLLALVFPSTKGIEAISRGALIASVFVILSIVLVLAFVPYSDMNYFNDNDISFSIADGIDTAFIFAPMILSFYFFRNINREKGKSVIFPFAAAALIILIVMCFIKLLSISEYNYVFYTLCEISCKLLPMGFSGLFIAFSLICVFFALLYFTLSVKTAVKTNTKLMSVIYVITVYVLSLITLYNDNMYNILLNRYFMFALYIVLALFTPMGIIIRNKIDDSIPKGDFENPIDIQEDKLDCDEECD